MNKDNSMMKAWEGQVRAGEKTTKRKATKGTIIIISTIEIN